MNDTIQNEAQTVTPFSEDQSSSSSIDRICEHMNVFGSCGNRLGRVDHVQGDMIKLTRNGSSDGLHHFIPTSWVSDVDQHVHLSMTCRQAKREWQGE